MTTTETDEVLDALAAADATAEKEAPCSVCGETVSLERVIVLTLEGNELFEDREYRSSEAAVRVVMQAMFDIAPPPVICDKHVNLYEIGMPEIDL